MLLIFEIWSILYWILNHSCTVHTAHVAGKGEWKKTERPMKFIEPTRYCFTVQSIPFIFSVNIEGKIYKSAPLIFSLKNLNDPSMPLIITEQISIWNSSSSQNCNNALSNGQFLHTRYYSNEIVDKKTNFPFIQVHRDLIEIQEELSSLFLSNFIEIQFHTRRTFTVLHCKNRRYHKFSELTWTFDRS